MRNLDQKLELVRFRDLARCALAEAQSRARAELDDYYCEPFSADEQEGFLDGFVDYLDAGGTGNPPPLPPRRYWKAKHENPNGNCAVQDWYRGYARGVAAAQVSGYREMVLICPSDSIASTREPYYPGEVRCVKESWEQPPSEPPQVDEPSRLVTRSPDPPRVAGLASAPASRPMTTGSPLTVRPAPPTAPNAPLVTDDDNTVDFRGIVTPHMPPGAAPTPDSSQPLSLDREPSQETDPPAATPPATTALPFPPPPPSLSTPLPGSSTLKPADFSQTESPPTWENKAASYFRLASDLESSRASSSPQPLCTRNRSHPPRPTRGWRRSSRPRSLRSRCSSLYRDRHGATRPLLRTPTPSRRAPRMLPFLMPPTGPPR